MPSYGDEMTRGFYLQNGGYYFAINDYVDLAVTVRFIQKDLGVPVPVQTIANATNILVILTSTI